MVAVTVDADAEAKERRAAAAAAELMRGVVASMQVGGEAWMSVRYSVRTMFLTYNVSTACAQDCVASVLVAKEGAEAAQQAAEARCAGLQAQLGEQEAFVAALQAARYVRAVLWSVVWCDRSRIVVVLSNMLSCLLGLFSLRDTLEERAAEEEAKASQAQEELQNERAQVRTYVGCMVSDACESINQSIIIFGPRT